MVQIHSPRPNFQSTIYEHTNSCGAPGHWRGGQWFKLICPDNSFPSHINALRCVLNWDSYFIFADNTDKICGFVWKFTVLSQPKLSWRMISEAS